MQAIATWALCVSLVTLAGCGQKGPLIRPATRPPADSATVPAGAAGTTTPAPAPAPAPDAAAPAQ